MRGGGAQTDPSALLGLVIDLLKEISKHDNHSQNEKIEISSHSAEPNDKMKHQSKTLH